MDTFFPSEIARLVLGYLKEDKCIKSWQTFLEESSNLREYFSLYKRGKVYSTNVNGYSLLDILNEYCVLKFQAINEDPKKKCLSKSEIVETLKEEDFVESTKQTVDCAFQKYFSPSDNLRNNVSTDLSPDVCELLNHNSCGSKEIKHCCTDVTKNLSINKFYHCSEQNAISAKNNGNESYERDKAQGHRRNKKLNTELDAAKKRNDHLHQFRMRKQTKDFSDNDTSPNSLTSFIQSLSDQLNRKGTPTSKLPNFVQQKQNVKENNQSLSKLKPLNEEDAVSPTKTVILDGDDDDDDDIEIVKEIEKEEKCPDNLSPKDRISCISNTSANQKAIDNVAEDNTQINKPRHEINLSNTSNVEVLQTNNSKDIRKEQTDANDQININAQESKTDSSNNPVSFIDSGTFIQPSAVVNEMTFPYPQNYILPNYAPSSSFTNNTPVYVVLNTPGTSSGPIINGTILTVPTVQTNTASCPVLPTVSTAYVNTAVNNFSSSLPTTNIVANDKISLPSTRAPQKGVLTPAPIGLLNTLEKNNISKTKVDDRVLKSSLKTYSKESQSSKVSKRKNSPHEKGQKEKIKNSLLAKGQPIPTPEASILSLTDYKGKHSIRSKISSDSCPSKVQKATKRKRTKEKKDEKCKKNKTPVMSPPLLKVKIVKPKPETSLFQSDFEEQFPQHDEIEHNFNPSNIITKTYREGNDCTKSISTYSTSQNNFNNSTLIKPSLPGMEENRVLKVLLSDIFVNIHHKIDSLHDQESDSNAELSMQDKSENQISDQEN